MAEEKNCLEEMKKKYKDFQKQYGLPDFDELNRNFFIEEVAELKTDFLIRGIRRAIAERFSNYLKFIEDLLHPTSASIFVFSIIKSLKMEDKKLLEDIYKKIAKIEIEIMELDILYSEQKEAEFVKKACGVWCEIGGKWIKIISSVKNAWDNDSKEDYNKDYFG